MSTFFGRRNLQIVSNVYIVAWKFWKGTSLRNFIAAIYTVCEKNYLLTNLLCGVESYWILRLN